VCGTLSLSKRKAVFLDRDGVINKRPPRADYVKKWEEFEFLPGAVEGLQLLSRNNYDIYLVSNQPGIVRGAMTKEDLDDVQRKLDEELAKYNVKLAGVYFCLHNWDDGCDCRKPKPGLLFQAAREHNLDLSKVVFVGDDERDTEAGEAAGTVNVFMNSNENLLEVLKANIKEI